MNNDNDVYIMLKRLEENGIPYVILRDFIPISNIETSLDVDIYIPKQYKSQVNQVFESMRWYTPFMNSARFPHKQYIYVSEKIIHKIDIVYDLCYGKELYNLKDIDLIEDSIKVEEIYVPNYSKALLTLVLHIVFDKQIISDKNKRVFDRLYDEALENNVGNIEIEKDLVEIYNEIRTNSIEFINKRINMYREKLINKKILKSNYIKSYLYRTRTKINYKLRTLSKRLANNSICFIGVDGSGKSTVVSNLSTVLNNHSSVQYMGFKDWELKFVKEHFNNKKDRKVDKVKSLIYIYIEMWYRYLKNRFSDKLIIYDRYVDEAYINSSGTKKMIYTILYKYIFPKPRKIVYLHCNVLTSFSRKDDILDKNEFAKMKERFDNIFLCKDKLNYSTDDQSQEDLMSEITKLVNKDLLKSLI